MLYPALFLIFTEVVAANIKSEFPGRLPEPTSYYAGISHSLRPRSDNLIIFQRRCREALQQQNFSNRSHYRHVLILNLETCGSVIIDGNELRLEPGLACYIRPFQFHHYLNLEAEALNWLFLTFDLEAGAEALARLCDLAIAPGDADIAVWKNVAELAAEKAPEPANEALAWLDVLLLRLLNRYDSAPQSRPAESWIARAEGLVLRSVSEEWTLEEVGRRLGVSERQLRKLFKREMGVSIRDYRANYQLNRAISLMRNPKLALGRIAELSGFRSQAVFNRFVKRQTGLTPKMLRENALGAPDG